MRVAVYLPTLSTESRVTQKPCFPYQIYTVYLCWTWSLPKCVAQDGGPSCPVLEVRTAWHLLPSSAEPWTISSQGISLSHHAPEVRAFMTLTLPYHAKFKVSKQRFSTDNHRYSWSLQRQFQFSHCTVRRGQGRRSKHWRSGREGGGEKNWEYVSSKVTFSPTQTFP